jgi:hypothetical protein
MKTSSLTALFALLSAVSASAIQIADTFNDGVIDTSLWEISLPFGGSQVQETGGNAVLTSRGGLNTLTSFAGPVEIAGSFSFAGALDHFRVVFRSDLSFNSPTMERSGMIVVFNQDGEVQIGESEISSLAIGTFNPAGKVDFRILDDGTTVNLFVNDAVTPLLTADSSYRTGEKIGFYNREFPFNVLQIDRLQISSVPDTGPGIAGTAAAVILLILCQRRSRNCHSV